MTSRTTRVAAIALATTLLLTAAIAVGLHVRKNTERSADLFGQSILVGSVVDVVQQGIQEGSLLITNNKVSVKDISSIDIPAGSKVTAEKINGEYTGKYSVCIASTDPAIPVYTQTEKDSDPVARKPGETC